MFDTIIFDLDNTLYDYDLCHNYAIKLLFESILKDNNITNDILEYDILEDVYNQVNKQLKIELGNTASSHNRFIYIKHLIESIHLHYYMPLKYDAVLKYNSLYWKYFFDKILLFDGVLELLKSLKANNIRIALLTDFQTQEQFLKLQKLDILEYFDTIITSEEIGIEKPSSKAFTHILNKLNILPHQALIIGDNLEKDIYGALQCNISAIHLNRAANLIDNTLAIKTNKYNKVKYYIEFNAFIDIFKWFEKLFLELHNFEYISKQLGQRIDLVQAGGGNISFKLDNLLIIKASGCALVDVAISNINSYCLVNNSRLLCDLGVLSNFRDNSATISLDNYVIFGNDYKRPSIETFMHCLMNKWVVHLHPVMINKFLISNSGITLIRKLFSNALIIPYLTPGIAIYQYLEEHIKNKNFDCNYIFLENHGIIITGNNIQNILDTIAYIHSTLLPYTNTTLPKQHIDITHPDQHIDNSMDNNIVNKLVDTIITITGKQYIVYSVNKRLVYNVDSLEVLNKITCPDQLIYCGLPCFCNNENYESILEYYYNTNCKQLPNILIINSRIFIISNTLKKCIDIEQVLLAMLDINTQNIYTISGDKMNELGDTDINYLLNWDAEKWRKKL